LIATPAFHHWHHTLGEPRDRNYASMLPCMDRLFGTWHLPRKQWPSSYGIDAKLPDSLGMQLIYPFLPPAQQAQSQGAVAAELPERSLG
jgi:sterol desaturase/sphingolipid hydroxylase (fatty acid hydroxylase superfamily)